MRGRRTQIRLLLDRFQSTFATSFVRARATLRTLALASNGQKGRVAKFLGIRSNPLESGSGEGLAAFEPGLAVADLFSHNDGVDLADQRARMQVNMQAGALIILLSDNSKCPVAGLLLFYRTIDVKQDHPRTISQGNQSVPALKGAALGGKETLP